ncbi:hypothetical protein ZIOFF_051007 [Zingiber officinale]|uniref:Reverse transcriptase domain-containing protein n=1 Tax=Zingiber officinale TaxID=94328 RepID=A0A8J5FJT2_ZINOF|nr:hypothetical protein ZIOFF_051007 [Zingiber officinale]
MHPDSIEWTAFWVPEGLYEWFVMSFGLKNTPAIFQRKMDNYFKGTEEFIAIYIADILVFSQNEEDPAKNLKIILQICEENGLILSPTKMKIAINEVEFLGVVIGILNYARSYIPNLGKILGPLYSKTSPNGEKRMNAQDWSLINKVKSMIKELPELAIPPANCYIIIEADGCMEG